MKRIYFSIMMLAMMVAALSFTSCGGGDDDETDGSASIVGVWECISSDYGEWEDYLDGNTEVGDLLQINSNGTYSIIGNGNDSGTWKQNGKSLSLKSNDSYSVQVTYTITQLTPTNLSLSLTENVLSVKVSFRRAK